MDINHQAVSRSTIGVIVAVVAREVESLRLEIALNDLVDLILDRDFPAAARLAVEHLIGACAITWSWHGDLDVYPVIGCSSATDHFDVLASVVLAERFCEHPIAGCC